MDEGVRSAVGGGRSAGRLRARWWESAGGIALLYLAAAATWILVSDRVVEMVFGVGHAAALAQSVKGLAWIAGTALVLFLLIRSAERSQREAGRRASESASLLRMMGGHVQDVFWITQTHPERTLYVSPAFEWLWGRRVEEVYKNPRLWVDCIHEDDRGAVTASFEAMLRDPGNCRLDVEYRVRRPDGSITWVRDRGYPVVDDEGRATQVVGLAEDITERKKTESALLRSEGAFRALVDMTGNAYLVVDFEGRVEEADAAYVALVGASNFEEIRGRRVTEWTAAHDLERNAAEVAKCTQTGSVRGLEIDYVKPDGTIQPIEVNAAVVETDRGPRILSQCKDISERKRAERALQDVNERLEAILNNAPSVAIQGYERDGRVAFWNGASETLYGWKASEIVGKRLGGRLLTEDDEAEFLRIVEHAIRSGQPAPVREWKTTNARGDSRWCLSSIFPIRYGDGHAQVVCMDVDITSRREIEAALRESEQRFRQLTEAIKEAFWLTDWKARRVLYVSPAYEAIWGRTTGSLYAKARSWADVLHPDDRERVIRSFEDDAPRGRYDTEYRIVRDDGKVRWIHDRAFPILNERGEVWRMAGISEDVTERKLAEERQSLMMQELDHRVKNNLAAALSLADMTARHCATLEEFQEVFTGRLAALARMHALLARTRWHGVRMLELVERTLEPFMDLAEGRVRVEGPDAMLTTNAASPMCMALHELTTNAVKHGALGAPGGRVEVRWEVDGPLEAPRSMRVVWTERGGPEVREPERKGFGSTLIKGAIEYQLDGRVTMTWEPSGLRCDLEVDFAKTREPEERWPRAGADGFGAGGVRTTR